MRVQDYPVTQGYGYDPSYPINGGQHRGIDYGAPHGTPVVVNGVTIGLVGRTGYVTGPHLHIGRWVGGQPTDPGVGNGFNLPDAVVHSTGYDNTNGNYIRISSGGALWVYLHLSQINVSSGQTLKGGEAPMNDGDITNIYRTLLGRDPDPGGRATYVNRPWKDVFYAIAGSPEYRDRQTALNAKDKAIQDLQVALQNEQSKPPKEVIKEVEKIVEVPVEKEKIVKETVYIHDEKLTKDVSYIRGLLLNFFKLLKGLKK